MSVGVRPAAGGADLRPAPGPAGRPLPCPHWGYMLRGGVRMHTAEGQQDYGAGDAFYWAPGHAPEALEDSEYVDFSPTAEIDEVIAHIRSQG